MNKGASKVERPWKTSDGPEPDAGSIPAASTTEAPMTEEIIRAVLLKMKDQLFRDARMVREKGGPIFPVFGALMPDGQFPIWGIGDAPEGAVPGLVRQASENIRGMGAVGALFFADGTFQPFDKQEEDKQSLLCLLTMKDWEQVWVWWYVEGEEGWEWSPEEPEFAASADMGRAFCPFPQVPFDRGRVH